VFDGEELATSGVKGFDMPSSQTINQEECGASQSTPTAFARSSHMQSCDVRSSIQHTSGSTAMVTVQGNSNTTPGTDRIVPNTPTSLQAGKQQMQWPFVKGLMEVRSPGTPGSQKAGPFSAVPGTAAKADLDTKPYSSDSVTKWEPLPCPPSQIVAGYAFVIDGPVAPEIGSKQVDGDENRLWPSITAVELNAETITAICKAKGKDIRHDTSLLRTDSMDALVQVHVVPTGGQSEFGGGSQRLPSARPCTS
jgi:hypothetical protein